MFDASSTRDIGNTLLPQRLLIATMANSQSDRLLLPYFPNMLLPLTTILSLLLPSSSFFFSFLLFAQMMLMLLPLPPGGSRSSSYPVKPFCVREENGPSMLTAKFSGKISRYLQACNKHAATARKKVGRKGQRKL